MRIITILVYPVIVVTPPALVISQVMEKKERISAALTLMFYGGGFVFILGPIISFLLLYFIRIGAAALTGATAASFIGVVMRKWYSHREAKNNQVKQEMIVEGR